MKITWYKMEQQLWNSVYLCHVMNIEDLQQNMHKINIIDNNMVILYLWDFFCFCFNSIYFWRFFFASVMFCVMFCCYHCEKRFCWFIFPCTQNWRQSWDDNNKNAPTSEVVWSVWMETEIRIYRCFSANGTGKMKT